MAPRPFYAKRLFWLTSFVIVIFLNFVIGCNYYRVTQVDTNNYYSSINSALENDKFLLVYSTSGTYQVNTVEITENSMLVELDSISDEIIQVNKEVQEEKGKRYKLPEHKPITSEVRIYMNDYAEVNTNTSSIEFKDIKSVDIFDKNTGKSIGFAALSVVGFASLIIIVALASKSSCPFIYSYDGEAFAYEGESYGGAIFKPLERKDFMPLNYLDDEGPVKTIRIANELKEKQFINQVELIQVRSPKGTQVLPDRHGELYSVRSPVAPLSAISDGVDYKDILELKNAGSFSFHTGTDLSEIILEFPNEQREGKLVINAKGSLWLDYLYGELSKLYGEQYMEFIQSQNQRDPAELEDWIRNQHLKLTAYEETEGGWMYIDDFDIVGPIINGRDLVMNIPENLSGEQTRRIKLVTGYLFWDLNYAGLDYSPNEVMEKRIIKASTVTNQDGIDQRSNILHDDSVYLEQLQTGNFATLQFNTELIADQGSEVSNILSIKGYYEHVRDYKGDPNNAELFKFREPGYYSDFSRSTFNRMYSELTASE